MPLNRQKAVAQRAEVCTSEQRVPGLNPATAWLDFNHRQLWLAAALG